MFWISEKREAYRLMPLILPWILISGGILFTLLQSFNLGNPVGGAVSGRAYAQVLGSGNFWRSLSFTFYVAFVSAALSTFLGFFMALYFWRLPLGWQKVSLMYKVFLILPHISITYLVLLLFSQTGILSAIFLRAGLIDDYRSFPILIFDNRGIGVILGYLIKEIPFSILLISALLRNIPENTLITARMLGANRRMIIFRILLPETAPAVVSSFFILFLYAFGAFEMPFILGGSRPAMLSISIYDLIFRKDFSYRAEAMVMLILMFLVNLVFILLYLKVTCALKKHGRTP